MERKFITFVSTITISANTSLPRRTKIDLLLLYLVLSLQVVVAFIGAGGSSRVVAAVVVVVVAVSAVILLVFDWLI
jgi:hypothetical protein